MYAATCTAQQADGSRLGEGDESTRCAPINSLRSKWHLSAGSESAQSAAARSKQNRAMPMPMSLQTLRQIMAGTERWQPRTQLRVGFSAYGTLEDCQNTAPRNTPWLICSDRCCWQRQPLPQLRVRCRASELGRRSGRLQVQPADKQAAAVTCNHPCSAHRTPAASRSMSSVTLACAQVRGFMQGACHHPV